jgi:hypothetical protein
MPKYDEEGNLISMDDDDTLEFSDDDSPPPDDVVDTNDDTFKHKYDVLQGKYNAETSRQDAMITQLLREKATAELEAENLRVSVRDPYKPSDQDSFETEISKLESEFPSLTGGIKALIDKIVKEKIKPTEDRIESATNLSAKTAYDSFLRELDGAMSDWRTINVDPEFTAWLSEPDRYTGAAKMDLLKGAYSNMSVPQTLAFFEDFAASKGSGGGSQALDTGNSNPAPTTRKGIAPTNAGGNLTSDTTPATITRADIANFYKLRAVDRWNGTEEEAAKYEARILKAVKEKKVR